MSKITSKLLTPFLKLKIKRDVKKLSDDKLKEFLVCTSYKVVTRLPKKYYRNYFIVRKYVYLECKKRKII